MKMFAFSVFYYSSFRLHTTDIFFLMLFFVVLGLRHVQLLLKKGRPKILTAAKGPYPNHGLILQIYLAQKMRQC